MSDGLLHICQPSALHPQSDVGEDDYRTVFGGGLAGYRPSGVIVYGPEFFRLIKQTEGFLWFANDLAHRVEHRNVPVVILNNACEPEWAAFVLKALTASDERKTLFRLFWAGE